MSFVDKYSSKSFTSNLMASRTDELTYLVRGEDKGRKAWHYIIVDKAKLPIFLKRIEKETIDIADYGTVIFSGWGENPPEEIVEKVKNKEYKLP
jgi:hypothetical protein